MATYANVGHILLKRGNTIQSSSYTGPLGELTINTDTMEVSVHDNSTAGGLPLVAGGGGAITGATGLTGATGPQGVAGLTGATGSAGAVGATGTQGATGPQGTTGATGPQGTTGATGPQGATGTVGPDGATGVTGASGPRGATGPIGNNGATGPVGNDGATGLTGASGPQGATGVKGDDGSTGPVGPDGATGLTGASGPQGATGVKGDDGSTGPVGPDGATGLTGATGAHGATGVQGLTGSTGPVGSQGATGLSGSTGPIGATGVKGDTGSTGPRGATGAEGGIGATGATGPQGDQGVSVTLQGTLALIADLATVVNPQSGDAWIVTESNGGDLYFYTPSLTWENIGKIVGPAGATGSAGPVGATGVTGADGATGPQGATGPDGQVGATGEIGSQGATGIDGATGVTGDVGATGLTGATGEIGNDGATGATGPQGVDGATGPQGEIGATGEIGNDGATGATGPQGVDGATGEIGPQGATGEIGNDGATGLTGPVGPDGATGPTGDIGATGEIGPQGATGLTGLDGATGPTGNDGATGATGEVGATGLQGDPGPGANQDLNTYDVVTFDRITLTSGDGNTLFTPGVSQITFGYNHSAEWAHFVHTRHQDTMSINNAIDFYTNDGTQLGTFPTNSIHGLTISDGKIGVGGITTPDYEIDTNGTAALGNLLLKADGSITLASSLTNPTFVSEINTANNHLQTVFEAYDTSHAGGDGDKGKGPAVILDVDGSTAKIRSWGTSNVWNFTADGSMDLPGALNFPNGSSQISSGMGFHISSTEPVDIAVTNNAGIPVTHNWYFGTDGHFVPGTDNTQDIGTPTARVRHVYVGPGSITIGDSVLSESATGKLVVPGLTRATAYHADEVEDSGDQTYSFSTNPYLMDAYYYAVNTGQLTPAPGYTFAEYDSNSIDGDGYIDGISVYTAGSYDKTVADYNRNNDMYAYIGSNISEPFNSANWVQIPFRVRSKADDVEYEFSQGSTITVGEIDSEDSLTNDAAVTKIGFSQADGFTVTELDGGLMKVNFSGGGGATDRLVAGEYSAVLDPNGTLTVPGVINVPEDVFRFNTTIVGIDLGSQVFVNLADSIFGGPSAGQVTISDVAGTTEINGTWYYMASDSGQFALYTDATYGTYVDGSTWTAYTGGGLARSSTNLFVRVGEGQWQFGDDGELTLPSGGRLGFAGKGWTGLDGGKGQSTSITSLYSSGMYSSCITLNPDGTLNISTYGDGTGQTGNWNFSGNAITFPDNTVQYTAYTGDTAGNPDRLVNGLNEVVLDENGDLRLSNHIIALNGRYYQDCADGTTSFRWINADGTGSDIELGRAYADGGTPYNGSQDESNERVQFGFTEYLGTSGNISSFYITSTQNNNGIGDGTLDSRWEFHGDGNLMLPQIDMMSSPAPVSWPGITFSDGTFQNTAYTGANVEVSPSVTRSDTAPIANNGQLWFNTLDARMYIKSNGAWIDTNPVVIPEPEQDITITSVTFADGTVQTTAWDGNIGNITANATSLTNGEVSVTLAADGLLTLGNGTTRLGRLNDDDVALWADDTTEYVGLWHGGNQDISNGGYGPNVAITVGNTTNDDMYWGPDDGGHSNADWADGPQVNIDIVDKNWHFDLDGSFTLPPGGVIKNSDGSTYGGGGGGTGATGATGPEGATGPMGQLGATGNTGPNGATGPDGATGATGPAGASGATGPQGATGPGADQELNTTSNVKFSSVNLPAITSNITLSGATKTVQGNPYSVRSGYSSEYQIWQASSVDVVAAKVTVRLHNDYYTYTELFDVMLCKEANGNANVSYSLGARIKSNDSYPDGIVDVRLDVDNKLTLYYTSVQGDATFYTFDAVEFTKTV